MAKKGQLEVIPLRILGLDGKFESKIAPSGVLSVADNVQAIRRTDGGAVRLDKRNGFTEVTGGKSIDGGGSIAACSTGANYGDELILCDGASLYSRSDVLAKWVNKGKLRRVGVNVDTISGNESSLGDTALFSSSTLKPNTDIAYQGGYSCHVASSDGDDVLRPARVYVRDETTKQIVFSTTIQNSFRLKVIGLSSSFYVFSWLAATNKLQCRRIQVATPSTMSAAVDVATNVANQAAIYGGGVYDVAADSSGTPRMWVAYGDSSSHLVILSWTTGNALGIGPSTYTGINPNIAMGFLNQDFSGGNGYLAVATRVTGGSPAYVHSVRLITFSTTTGIESANALLEAYSGGSDIQSDPAQLTGYRSSGGVLNVYWSLYSKGSISTVSAFVIEGRRVQVRGYSAGSLFDVALSVGLASRVVKVGSKWYMLVAHHDGPPVAGNSGDVGNRTLLIELTENTVGANGDISFQGLIMGIDSGGVPCSYSCLPSIAQIDSNTQIASVAGVLNRASANASSDTRHHTVNAVTMDFAGTELGRPVVYNEVLHVPSAAHMTYDGRDVVEAGFFVDPVAPNLTAVAAGEGNGQLTPGKTYLYCCTWLAFDAKGRIWRSTPGQFSSVFLTDNVDPDLAENSVDVDAFNLRATNRDPKFNLADVVNTRIEVWRTEGDLEIFYLDRVLDNDATQDFQTYSDKELGDEFLVDNEILYTTTEELDNQKVPAVKVLHPFQTRLFALTGDSARSTWHTKEAAEGFGAEFSDEFRILLSDDSAGRPTTLGSVDTALVIFKRKRAFFTSGAGPDDKGAGNPFPAPQALQVDLGVINATGAVDVPAGIACETSVGRFTLTRALTFEPMEGPEGSSVTILGGVGVDSRSMTAFVTTGGLLVRDWQLSQWFNWTKAANGLAGVAIARWRNQLCVFQSDGTVLREIEGQYFDATSTAINEAAEFTYTRLENARIYQLRVVGEIMASTTLTVTTTLDGDDSTASAETRACTTGDKKALNVIPNTGRMESVKVRIEETSTTAGFRLAQIGLEVALKPGLKKSASSRNFS